MTAHDYLVFSYVDVALSQEYKPQEGRGFIISVCHGLGV